MTQSADKCNLINDEYIPPHFSLKNNNNMDRENEDVLLDKSKWSIWNYIPVRYFLIFMIFMGLCFAFCFRVGLSIALVAMVNSTGFRTSNITDSQCQNPEANSNYDFENQGEFYWDPYIQSIILGSFYYGYMLTLIPGGWLAEKYGSKWLFGGGIFWSSLFTLLCPVAARAGYQCFIVVRVLNGFGEGVTYPALFIMTVYWTTLRERSLLLAIAVMGGNVGTIIATPIAAYLCEHGFAGGWPSVFYVFGICGCIWFLIWCLCISDKPADNRWISNTEKLYLQQETDSTSKKLKIPWKSIFTSIPFWALIYTRFAISWGLFTVTAQLPSYLESALHLTLKQNGTASAITYIFLCIGMIIAGYISDYFRRKRHFGINVIRKSFECSGLIGCGICLIAIPKIGCNIPLIITVMSAGLFLFGFNTGGSTPTIVDMAPEFAGTMCGLTSTLPVTGAFLGPMITGLLTREGQTIEQWNSVFYIMAGVLISGGLTFLIWGSAEVQPWAKVAPSNQNLSSLIEEETTKVDNSDPINTINISQDGVQP